MRFFKNSAIKQKIFLLHESFSTTNSLLFLFFTILNYHLNILFVCHHFKANETKTSIKPVRIEAGLGDPPNEFTTNNVESGNFIIKHGINFDKQKPQEFIEKFKEIINMQFRNEDRAIFGKGPYNLRKGLEKYYVNDFKWGQLTAQQRLTKIKEFRNVCLSGKNKEPEKYSTISGSDNNLSISPKDSGINTVPLSVLERIFEKAKSLVRNDGLVLEKPGATDGSYIVAGSANRIFCVSSGKGGSFKCDTSWQNENLRTCHCNSRKMWCICVLALNGAPKSMGRKPNGRKRSNKKRADIEDVNIFAENEIENSSLHSLSPNNANGQNEKAINEKHINVHISDQMHFQGFNNILSVHSAPPVVQQKISNPFFLKWVSGATVSKCYGCNGSIPNPPLSMVDILIVARKDIRHYRDRNTGQLQFSSQPQNVHFHLFSNVSKQNILHLIHATSLSILSSTLTCNSNISSSH